jgi:hypothetical protein
MDNIVLEKSGELEWGYFYEIFISDDENFLSTEAMPTDRYLANQPARVRTRRRFPPRPIQALMAWEDSSPHTLTHDCSLNPEHVTQEYWNDIKIELTDGTGLPDLLELDADAQHSILLSEELANKLKGTSFTGYELCEMTVSRPQPCPYSLFELKFMGRKCFRPLSVVNAPNECP